MSLLQVSALSKYFGGLKAVDNCSFKVEEGSIVALIGPNGAGKTTVFNIITGLLKPTTGNVSFNGEVITGLRPHQITRRGISRTFQITRELMEMTVLENLIVQSQTKTIFDIFRNRFLDREHTRAMELLDFVGITHLANEQAKKLSYGQKKLMEFASVLMPEPRLVMLDEPAGGINPNLLESIIERIQELNRKGITFLIVEHNMEVVMNLSHYVIVMAHGQVLTQDTAEAVQCDPVVLDAYLGEA
ncbi:MAG: ABC transporter ATP-binding protein [Chloroflexi bacterium RBG_16_48_8]|nr:MAG: ABC transporter ATP-binding protein [Chloroflexi bacterium RBG_16_48_8]